MSTTISSVFSNCLQTILPCWFGDIPLEETSDDKASKDWAIVEIYKRNFNNEFIKTAKLDDQGKKVFDQFGNRVLVPKKFLYCMDSKGNLYNYWDGKMIKAFRSEEMVPMKETKGLISAKFVAIFVLTTPYILAVMSTHLLHTAYDIYRISKKAIYDFISEIKKGKLFGATINIVFTFAWKIPSVVMDDLWGVIRCIFFGVGMLFSGACGVCFPLESRKWYSKIEGGLHQHARAFQYPYCMRTDLWTEGEYFESIKDLYSRISWERPLYLGWCMLKKGNIHQYKFQRVATYEKPFFQVKRNCWDPRTWRS